MEDPLLRPAEVAKRLQAATRTVLEWLRDGKLKGVKVGRQWRVYQSVVDAFPRAPHPPARPDPFDDLNLAIAKGGGCTEPAQQNQLRREVGNRAFTPPEIPE